MIRVTTATASSVGPCDLCTEHRHSVLYSPDQIITVLTLHQEDTLVYKARFCQQHFLRFSDLISDQVASLLYPRARSA